MGTHHVTLSQSVEGKGRGRGEKGNGDPPGITPEVSSSQSVQSCVITNLGNTVYVILRYWTSEHEIEVF